MGCGKVLYVEDCDEMSRFVQLLLRRYGYSVDTARTAREGLERARSSTYDLYLLDIILPDGSGIELCRELRTFDRCTPVIFFSALDYRAEREQAIAAGAQGFCIKPVRCHEILETVGQVLHGRPNESEEAAHGSLKAV